MTLKKLGDPRGVKEWQNLESIGDCKRFLRWLVLSMRNQTLDRQDAGVFCQIANTLLRAVESHDLEQRIERLENTANGVPHDSRKPGEENGSADTDQR